MLKVHHQKNLAVCLSGILHPRAGSLKRLSGLCADYETLNEHILSKYSCDVFCFFWSPPITLLNETTSFLQSLQPKKYVLYDQIVFANSKNPEYRLLSMHYAIHQCNELRKKYENETGTRYDWVVRTRPDIVYRNDLIIPFDRSLVYIPNPVPDTHCQDRDGFNDQFSLATPENIDIVCNCFACLEKSISVGRLMFNYFKQPIADFHFEQMFKAYLEYANISVGRIDLQYQLFGRIGDYPWA